LYNLSKNQKEIDNNNNNNITNLCQAVLETNPFLALHFRVPGTTKRTKEIIRMLYSNYL